jgi:hypothetical protein
MRRYLRDLKSRKRRDAFDRFKSDYLTVTQTCRTLEDISTCVSDANVLIAGSDQIWNSYSLENGLDSAFYLDFGPEEAVKISYAASFGVNEVKEKDRSFVVEMLKNFDHISIREEKGRKLLEELGFKGKVVVDPVFLLDKKEWESLTVNMTMPAPYILIYSIGNISDSMFSMIRQIQGKTGYKAICVRSNRHIRGIEEITDAGPAEFVSLIKNASFVISNSFHATAFSLIFEKEFYSYPYETKSSERIVALLKDLKIEERYGANHFDETVKINYTTINEYIETLYKKSTEWLDLLFKIDIDNDN